MENAWERQLERTIAEARASQFVDEAIKAGAALTGDAQNPLPLGELAVALKEEGLLELALIALEEHCKRNPSWDNESVLAMWKEQARYTSWSMGRRDAARSSWTRTQKAEKMFRFAPRWRHAWPQASTSVPLTLDTPTPLIGRDLLIVPNPARNGFVGIDLRSGTEVWNSGIVAERLDYSASPVYVRPLLLYLVPPSIRIQSLFDAASPSEAIVSSERVSSVPFASPLAWGQKVVYPLARDVLVLDLATRERWFLPLSLGEGNKVRSPVACGNQVYVTTSEGSVFKLWEGSLIKVAELNRDRSWVFSAAAAVGKNLVFEAVNDRGHREARAYNPIDDISYSLELKGEFCDPDHTHLHFPPVSAPPGRWLAFSDTDPRLYLISQEAARLLAIPVDLEGGQPLHLPQEFSTVVDSLLVAKNGPGFVSLDMHSNQLRREVFQPHQAEMLAQPVVYGNLIFFLCGDGVICHDLH